MADDKMANTRREQLLRWMRERDMSRTDLAGRLKVGRAYVSLLFKTDRSFGEKAARSIEQKLFMPSGYLDATTFALAPIDAWESPQDLPEGVYALVPRIGVRLSAGSGLEAVEESELPPLAFRESWLKRKHVSSRKNLRVLEISGESMEPYLQDGDVVLVDLGQRDVLDGEVYAIAYGDELRIKRLSKRFDGGLIIRSDNPRFPEEIVAATDLQHIRVLGRHIWRGG